MGTEEYTVEDAIFDGIKSIVLLTLLGMGGFVVCSQFYLYVIHFLNEK